MLIKVRSLLPVMLVGLLLQGCGDGSSNGVVTPPNPEPPAPAVSLNEREQAALFLQRATFGPSAADVDELLAMGKEAWIDQQLAMPGCGVHYQADQDYRNSNVQLAIYSRNENWWTRSMQCGDQLRQRVALALSEIMVVSDADPVLYLHQEGLADYYDTLVGNAFGSYRALLKQVSLHPAMGSYLNMLGNEKSNPDKNTYPDENYAREVMQLFSIGLHELNADGTEQLDSSGHPIPTYGQDDIRELAKVLTGWSWRGVTAGSWEVLKTRTNPHSGQDYLSPMVAVNAYHDFDAKTILGQTFPAGQDAYVELMQVMDMLASHANVAPFISKQLIQRLVKSNPSPEYVARVVRAWKVSSGNLGQVVKAILLDAEAQSRNGRLVEPVLRVTQLWRAFDAVPNANGEFFYYNAAANMGQSPLSAPSVFNFYQPSYAPAGLSDGMVAPEFKLIDGNYYPRLGNDLGDMALQISRWDYAGMPDYATYVARLAEDGAEKTVAALSDLLVPGVGAEYDGALVAQAEGLKAAGATDETVIAQVVKQIVLSPQYAVQ